MIFSFFLTVPVTCVDSISFHTHNYFPHPYVKAARTDSEEGSTTSLHIKQPIYAHEQQAPQAHPYGVGSDDLVKLSDSDEYSDDHRQMHHAPAEPQSDGLSPVEEQMEPKEKEMGDLLILQAAEKALTLDQFRTLYALAMYYQQLQLTQYIKRVDDAIELIQHEIEGAQGRSLEAKNAIMPL